LEGAAGGAGITAALVPLSRPIRGYIEGPCGVTIPKATGIGTGSGSIRVLSRDGGSGHRTLSTDGSNFLCGTVGEKMLGRDHTLAAAAADNDRRHKYYY